MLRARFCFSTVLLLCCLFSSLVAQKPPITIDDHFNSVAFSDLKVSPDGNSVVIATERADWDQQIFRKDLWLYRDAPGGGTLTQLTRSGHDTDPQWSPDGRWIAFFSDRAAPSGKSDGSIFDANEEAYQVYLISPAGGEAFAVTSGEEEAHSFAWSADSKTLYYATRQPWSKEQKDSHKSDWKDVVQYRGDQRGDTIFSIEISAVLARHHAEGTKETPEAEKGLDTTPDSKPIAQTELYVSQMTVSDDGKQLAFVSESPSERQEKVEQFEIFVVDLAKASLQNAPRQVTKNEAVEQSAHWAADNRHILFQVDVGSVEGKYKDTQMRMYWVDSQTGQTERWAGEFGGAVGHYSRAADGSVTALGRLGTQVQVYSTAGPASPFTKREGWAGTYELVSMGAHSPKVAFAYSALERPTEIYLAESADKLAQARPITSFNKLFNERELPKGKPYRWTADDGTSVEGMLMFPPGKFEAKHLPMLVLIHGGPADADGDSFEADWYQWNRLAATQGWLVFEPNYRGSTGYGDKFLMGIVPQLVSRPGKDILEGVDALVKDGIADKDHLAVGGYSYGGYMTNWLITQSTQWKAAVTGAGSVEHVGDWGNDDTVFDDAYFLGGRPWEASKRYVEEGAIYQFDKVVTPTHVVGGEDDVRVAVSENYLLDEALHSRGIPEELLIFPGEGHSLTRNPWHGKIKVREELKWLQKYSGVGAPPSSH